MQPNKQYDLAKLKDLVSTWRRQGEVIVFTNGCFDLLHPGHLHSLNQAKQFGNRLVVGVNSDASVKRLKGVNRPIIAEQGRVDMLAALEVVDAVVVFEEDSPIHLIETILPDILVKGSDYKKSNIVGADIVEMHGGKVELINLVPGFSTSELVKKIKSI